MNYLRCGSRGDCSGDSRCSNRSGDDGSGRVIDDNIDACFRY